MKNNPKVSIVTPSYNQGLFIEETIDAVLSQNYPNIEYIIIDGGSQDNSVQIIKKYAKYLHFWASESDNGQTHAINKGFKIASGQYISWLNSDDLLFKEGVQNVVDGFKTFEKADFIHGQQIYLSQNGQLEKTYPTNFPNIQLDYLGSFPYSQPSCFFKRSITKKIGYLDESFYSTMDLDYFLKIALNFSIQYIDKPIGIFREQPKAKTATYNKTWDLERRKTISQLFRTYEFRTGIELLKELDCYVEGQSTYQHIIQLTNQELNSILGLFLKDSINFYFHAFQFQEAYLLTSKIKILSPNIMTNHLHFLHDRAKFYRFPIIHLLTRPLSYLK